MNTIEDLKNKLYYKTDIDILNNIISVVPELKNIKNLKKSYLLFPCFKDNYNFCDYEILLNHAKYKNFKDSFYYDINKALQDLKFLAKLNAKIKNNQKTTSTDKKRYQNINFINLLAWCDNSKIYYKVIDYKENVINKWEL